MKPIRMRTIRHRSRSLLIVALALAAGTALAGPKKGSKGGAKSTAGAKGSGAGSGAAAGAASGAGSGSGSASGAAGGDIEMDSGGGGGTGSGGGTTGGAGAAAGGDIEMDEPAGSKDLGADLNAADQNTQVVKSGPVVKTPVSWKDIVVVIRKPFLKVRRTELYPFVGTTMNDNLIHHYSAGGEFNYYLTDVLAVGVEGQYFTHSFPDTYDLVARQARRLPTVNEYMWSAALDFHYVPVYGKFAVLDHKLITWEAFFTAGVGAGQSQVIPRDTKFPGFTNILIEPNVGASMRFFIAKWLTVNLGVRDYMFVDKFEPTNRCFSCGPGGMPVNATASQAEANADTSFINNIMFQIGISFWLPTSFEYTTFR
jgi:outer membrane beta-barrel protein